MHFTPSDSKQSSSQKPFFTKWFVLGFAVVSAVTMPLVAQTSAVNHASGNKDTTNTEALAKEDTEKLAEGDKKEEKQQQLDYDEASIYTRKDARTMSLDIPAPRGQIVDRFGLPFAQTKVIWYPALQMRQFKDESDAHIISWSREKITKMNDYFGCEIDVSDKELVEHYRHRRWIPMPFKFVVPKKKRESFKKEAQDEKGIILHPIYQRVYPQKDSAAHIIGYVGSKKINLEKGPINYGDPLFWELEGRGGLEKKFDKVLQGTNGQRKLQYDSFGREVRRQDFPPKPGGTVVTTIDLEWQKRAEEVLKKHSRRGAFVVIDIETGEVLVMASRPSYDLNLWVPYMDTETYNKLREDESKPLYARAFQGLYPPASAFKVVTGIAALDSRTITKDTLVDCPPYIELGRHKFWDWSKKSRGRLSILTATALSNNPYFIQLALATQRYKPGRFMEVASLLGYGKKTELPVDGEQSGNLLSDAYTLRKYKRKIKQGDIANASIGQGAILASPLQVAQSMAAIANDGVLPKLHLIKQVQNDRGIITMASKPQPRDVKGKIDAYSVRVVKHGMFNVVNEPYGTGKSARISYAMMCGKTGTAQWGPEHLNQNLAWFAGYFPHDKPKYAFAALYEGAPNEKVSGGRNAGPIVSSFFEPLKEEAIVRHRKPNRAMIVDAGDDLVSPLGDPNRQPAKALIVEDEAAPVANPVTADEGSKPPKALIVEDDEDLPEPDPNAAENPADPAVSDPTKLPPAPKAIIVEEPEEPAEPEEPEPPLRDLPSGVTDPAPPAGPASPTNPTDPTEPPRPPKAIPVE